MPKIEQYAARGVYDPPAYSQAVKVTGGETILYIAGQVAYDDTGGVAHPGDFKAQARACLQAVKAEVEAGGGTMANIVKVRSRRSPYFRSTSRRRANAGLRLPAQRDQSNFALDPASRSGRQRRAICECCTREGSTR